MKIPSRLLHLALIFYISFMFLGILEIQAKSRTPDGIHFQKWDSEYMWQTLPLAQLKANPWESLWYLHKQPPGFNIIRSAIAQCFNPQDAKMLLRYVDVTLYLVWLVIFVLMVCLIFLWLWEKIGPYGAWIFALLWMLHPAGLYYATLLENTLITSAGFLWFFYELWRLASSKEKSITRLAASVILLFAVRSMIQIYFLVVTVIALILLKLPVRKIAAYCGLLALVLFPYFVKQYALFGTFSSCALEGVHLCWALRYEPAAEEMAKVKSELKLRYPNQADRYANDFLNNADASADNRIRREIVYRRFLSNPWDTLARLTQCVLQNSPTYWKPSSRYYFGGENVLVDRLPWRDLYDRIFSAPFLTRLLGLAFLCWLISLILADRQEQIRRIRFGASITILMLYIYVVSQTDWEGDRLKFFIEPVLYFFIVTELWGFISIVLNQKTRSNLLKKTTSVIRYLFESNP